MKVYTKLPMPADSSWGKKTWKYYSPIWFNIFAEGVYNIIRWIPTIYKDKDWDDFYITKLLQVKIEHQREYLVKHNLEKADVIIFDEATSSLDTHTESSVMQSIYSLKRELTIIIIAHRHSTLKNCDKIIELGSNGVKRIGKYSDFTFN